MTLTDAIKEAYASCPADVAVLETIEVNHVGWANPIRLVRDKSDLVATLESTAPYNPSAAVTFTALDFSIDHPRVGEGRQELTVSFDNVTAALMPIIQGHDLTSANEVKIIYRPYLSSDLSGPHMNPPLTLVVKSIAVSMYRVSLACGYADFANYRFPRKVYTSDEFPGIAPRV
jgi:hypothetical protein